jgi:hypothetical protein
VNGVDQRIALNIEDNAGYEKNRCLHGSQPSIAGSAAYLKISVPPTRYVLLIEPGDRQVVRIFKSDTHLVFRNLPAGVNELLEHRTGVSRAGINDGPPRGIPPTAIDSRALPALWIESRVRDAIQAHGGAARL